MSGEDLAHPELARSFYRLEVLQKCAPLLGEPVSGESF
jgi:hypothetical protein